MKRKKLAVIGALSLGIFSTEAMSAPGTTPGEVENGGNPKALDCFSNYDGVGIVMKRMSQTGNVGLYEYTFQVQASRLSPYHSRLGVPQDQGYEVSGQANCQTAPGSNYLRLCHGRPGTPANVRGLSDGRDYAIKSAGFLFKTTEVTTKSYAGTKSRRGAEWSFNGVGALLIQVEDVNFGDPSETELNASAGCR